MKQVFLFASMAIAAGLAMVNVYTSVVDVPAWSHHVPQSVDTARQYYTVSNPGNFFRIFSPVNQLLGLACLILFWKRSPQVRLLLATAFVMYVIGEGMTFMYFYPRNAIILGAQSADTETLQSVLSEWSSMNWVRSLVIVIGCVCSGGALHKTYTAALHKKHSTTKRREMLMGEPA